MIGSRKQSIGARPIELETSLRTSRDLCPLLEVERKCRRGSLESAPDPFETFGVHGVSAADFETAAKSRYRKWQPMRRTSSLLVESCHGLDFAVYEV